MTLGEFRKLTNELSDSTQIHQWDDDIGAWFKIGRFSIGIQHPTQDNVIWMNREHYKDEECDGFILDSIKAPLNSMRDVILL